MAAYRPELWRDFFVATAGAAAALTGLLFVAMSINLRPIVEHPSLPRRAACTLGLLTAVLVTSICALAAGQSTAALGLEVLAVGVLVLAPAVRLLMKAERTEGEPSSWLVVQVVTLLLPAVVLTVAGVSLATTTGGGLYWVLASFVLAFAGTVLNAWVLLIEIQR